MRPASVCVQPFSKSGGKLFFSLVLNLFKLVLCLEPSEQSLGKGFWGHFPLARTVLASKDLVDRDMVSSPKFENLIMLSTLSPEKMPVSTHFEMCASF